MQLSTALNVAAMTIGFVGAGLVGWVGRKEGPGLPFYANAEGSILREVAAENSKRQRQKDLGMALVAVSFFVQLVALCF